MDNLTRLDNVGSEATKIYHGLEAILEKCTKHQKRIQRYAPNLKRALIQLEKQSLLTNEILIFGEEKLNLNKIKDLLVKANSFEESMEEISIFITKFSNHVSDNKEVNILSVKLPSNLSKNINILLSLKTLEVSCQEVTKTFEDAIPAINKSIVRINSFFSYENGLESEYDCLIFSKKNQTEYYDSLFKILGRTSEQWEDETKRQSHKIRIENLEAVHKSLVRLRNKINQVNTDDRGRYLLLYNPNKIIYSQLDASIKYHETFLKDELAKGLINTPIRGNIIFGEIYQSSKEFKNNKREDSFIQFTARELYSLFTQFGLPNKRNLTLSVVNRLFPESELGISNINDFVDNLN